MNVLVCVKRVPDIATAVELTDDEQSVDGRHTGYAIGPHDSCAAELAVRIADETGGSATVLTLGPAEAAEQLRRALSMGCRAAVHIEADATVFGPADVAREIAAVVRDHEVASPTYDLILLGNDAADTADFQVGIRLAHLLGRPVINGVKNIDVTAATGTPTATVDGPGGVETWTAPLPAVCTVREGEVEPRYPSLKGRRAAKKAPVEHRAPTADPDGSGRLRLRLPPTEQSSVEILGEGPEAAPAVVDMLSRIGVAP